MPATDKYNTRAGAINSLLCVGLDSDYEKLPERFQILENPQFEFNKWIIDETAEFAAGFKINMAFYEARGEKGFSEIKLTMEYLIEKYSDIFTICDAKRADIGSANKGYVEAIFDFMGFDAVTLHPYLGREALDPFLKRTDKISIVLCRTSNPGAAEFQDLESDGKPLWQIVAEKVDRQWNTSGNCMLVVGATYPEELATVRKIAPGMTLLVPGVGAQGGSVEEAIKAGLDDQKKGLIINSSRSIIFSKDPKEEARKLRDEINVYR